MVDTVRSEALMATWWPIHGSAFASAKFAILSLTLARIPLFFFQAQNCFIFQFSFPCVFLAKHFVWSWGWSVLGFYGLIFYGLFFSGLSDEEDQKPVRLPLKVPVELQPRNNHAWARVQSLAQNPRLRWHLWGKVSMPGRAWGFGVWVSLREF